MILYHKSNLVYTVVFPQFLIFHENNSAETYRKLTLTSGHYYFVEKLKIVEKQLCELNCSYGKVSHALNFQNQESDGEGYFWVYTLQLSIVDKKTLIVRMGKRMVIIVNFMKLNF